MVHACDYPNHWAGGFLKNPLDLPDVDAPEFRVDVDEKVFAETIPMPETVAVSKEVLAGKLGREYITRNGDLIDIRVENGRWVYLINGWGRFGEAIATLEFKE